MLIERELVIIKEYQRGERNDSSKHKYRYKKKKGMVTDA